MRLLEIASLSVEFQTLDGTLRAVDEVSLTVSVGELVAIVGEIGLGQDRSHSGGHGSAAVDGEGDGEAARPSRVTISRS